MPAVEVRTEPLGSPVAQRLIAELNAELSRDYPPAQRFHSLAAEEVAEGAGAFLVVWLEDRATALGATRVVLETGDKAQAALGLYESAGYARIPCFGAYAASPTSICFEKRLSGDGADPAGR